RNPRRLLPTNQRLTTLVRVLVIAALLFPAVLAPGSAVRATGSSASGDGESRAYRAAERVQELPDGMVARLRVPALWVGQQPPLDSNPLTREAFVGADVSAVIDGFHPGAQVSGTVEIGYQFGFPVALPSSFEATLKTPEVSVTGGANARLAPKLTVGPVGGGGELGEAGVTTSAEATVLPSQELAFTLNPSAGITDVSLMSAELGGPSLDIHYADAEFHATNVLGPLNMRPYVKFTVTVAGRGSYLLTFYSAPTTLV
ncbi:hypothetical protein GL303_11265, partial [Nocardia seriolae]